MAEDRTRKRLLAIDVLLEDPEAVSDGLEAELYALRDTLHPKAPGGSRGGDHHGPAEKAER
jgi:hypothetical protein